ncbi:MAG: HAMP domain-containing histidine kinase [Clostridia bacterium]|nr:HAMP domain-containing histidine kinase [Clostridia bacterium]
MKLSNNPEIRRFLAIILIFTFLLCTASAFFSAEAAVFTFILGVFLITAFLIFTKKRYDRINNLTETIDRILHGADDTYIKSYSEGELSVLESDVQKMLVRLRDQKDILEKEKTFLADSIADISHQLRTPLTSINLILSLLHSSDVTEERKGELMRELSVLISRTEYLVSVLLKISRLDAGTVQFERKNTALGELIRKSAEPVMIPMDIKNQKLIIDTKDITLNCDYLWCLEAFGNILKNCTEHTPENGTVTVTAEDTPIYTEIVISDTGKGFDENDIPHIFERFYKGKNSSKESFGIGLNLSKMIISAHNGTIKARNAHSGGAEFVIRFYKQVV